MLLVSLLLASDASAACPPEVAVVQQELLVARTAKDQAHRAYHETNWDYRLAIAPDRDQVLAERDAARTRLKEAREELKVAKASARDLKALYASDQLICCDLKTG
jgi:hypothetical protein